MQVLSADGLRSTARTIPWLPSVAAAGVATVVVVARLADDAAFPLQIASVLLASGLGYVLDDPSFEVLGSSTTPLWRRRMDRLIVALPPTVVVFLTLLAWHGTIGRQETLALVVMFVGLVGMALGIAGVAVRRSGRGLGGIVVAPTLFVALILSTMVAPRWRPLPMGDVPGGWQPIYLRWAAAAVVGLVALAVSSRDRAARSRSRI